MSEWRPIETAPLDGTEVLVWDEDTQAVQRAAYIPYWGGDPTWQLGTCLQFGDETSQLSPTHWMPLPKAPA